MAESGAVHCSFRLTLRQALAVLWTTIRRQEVVLVLNSATINITRQSPEPLLTTPDDRGATA